MLIGKEMFTEFLDVYCIVFHCCPSVRPTWGTVLLNTNTNTRHAKWKVEGCCISHLLRQQKSIPELAFVQHGEILCLGLGLATNGNGSKREGGRG